MNVRDKNKALQITTPLLMLFKHPMGKCTLTKANVAHLGSICFERKERGVLALEMQCVVSAAVINVLRRGCVFQVAALRGHMTGIS